METIKIIIKLKNLTNIVITKEVDQGFYGGYIWAEGYGLSDNLLHISEKDIILQNTRFGMKEEIKNITSLKMLLDEILIKDTENSENIYWSDEKPWDYLRVSDGSAIESINQLTDRIALISNIMEIEAYQEYTDDNEYLESLIW